MCLADVGVLLFDGLWGTDRLLFLFLVGVVNVIYAVVRTPTPLGEVNPVKGHLRALAVKDALKLLVSELVLLLAVRAAMVFLPQGAGEPTLNIVCYVLFTTLFLTIINHLTVDLEALSTRGNYVGGILKVIKVLTSFMLSKQDKALSEVLKKETEAVTESKKVKAGGTDADR
ncbi:MAG: hypothetical protein KO464_02245 [Candidatus Methanofastidiosum sp.]|nr:hypothetical protein [Methanofastidiosum sp.]